MDSLDIFQRLPSGTRIWICSVDSMQEARTRLMALQQSDPGEYYVCDLMIKNVLACITPEQPRPHTVLGDFGFFGRPDYGRGAPEYGESVLAEQAGHDHDHHVRSPR